MAIKPIEFISNAVRAKEIVAVLARNGFADLLQKLDLPPRILSAFGTSAMVKRSQWERVRLVLEELGPTFIKIGQLLSTRPDVVPEALIDELRKLQETVPPVPFSEVQSIIEEGLERPVSEVFASFEEEAAAGASMAQVHFASLVGTGERVAVKVQRPGLEKTIDADFDILIWFARQAHERLENLRPYDLPGVVQTLREGLERELDFRREARSIQFFSLQNSFPEDICAPKVYEDLSSRRVLVMERIDGHRLTEIDPGSELAKRIARVGSRSLFHQILINGFFHADPHAGNLRLLEGKKLCLLDWGLTGQLTRRMRFGMVDLFLSFIRGDAEQVARTAIGLADSGNAVDHRTLERQIMFSIREHYDPATGQGDVGKAVLQLLYIFGRNGIDLARDYSLVAKSILCVEETSKALDPEYNLKSEFEPVLLDLIRERRSPWRMVRDARERLMQGLDYVQNLPDELHRILKKIEKDSLKLNLQHRGLEDLDHTISEASNKITLGIILGCLIMGSSLIITTKIPPLLFGYPIFGLIGFVLSMALGVWVAIDILRGGKGR